VRVVAVDWILDTRCLSYLRYGSARFCVTFLSGCCAVQYLRQIVVRFIVVHGTVSRLVAHGIAEMLCQSQRLKHSVWAVFPCQW
jgi:hypothetical protein